MPTADALPPLTPNQISALVVLMAEARQLTNTELRELAGFSLTGADNARLVELGLVCTDRSQRPFTHELTAYGWHVARRLHTVPLPRQCGSALRSLLTMLANVDRGLGRLGLGPADFFDPRSSGASSDDPTGASPTPVDPPGLVRAAYRELAVTPGSWVSLADLRELLDEYDQSMVDAALRVLARHQDVRVARAADVRRLGRRERAAAVLIGDEECHLLSIGVAPDPQRPADTPPAAHGSTDGPTGTPDGPPAPASPSAGMLVGAPRHH